MAEAARRQNLTAAAVGQRLRALENELGVSLVRRSGSTVRPSPACLRMMPRLRSILSDAALLRSDVSEDGLAGPYRLGVISTALADFVPSLVEHLRDVAPKVETTIVPGASSYLFEMLTRSELDAAILVQPSFQIPKELKVVVLDSQPFAFVTPKGHGFSKLPMIVYDKTSWGGEIAWRWIEKNLRPTHILCEMDAPETVASLVGNGVGRAILPIWKGLSMATNVDIEVIPSLPKRSVLFAHRASPIDQACLNFFET